MDWHENQFSLSQTGIRGHLSLSHCFLLAFAFIPRNEITHEWLCSHSTNCVCASARARSMLLCLPVQQSNNRMFYSRDVANYSSHFIVVRCYHLIVYSMAIWIWIRFQPNIAKQSKRTIANKNNEFRLIGRSVYFLSSFGSMAVFVVVAVECVSRWS